MTAKWDQGTPEQPNPWLSKGSRYRPIHHLRAFQMQNLLLGDQTNRTLLTQTNCTTNSIHSHFYIHIGRCPQARAHATAIFSTCFLQRFGCQTKNTLQRSLNIIFFLLHLKYMKRDQLIHNCTSMGQSSHDTAT